MTAIVHRGRCAVSVEGAPKPGLDADDTYDTRCDGCTRVLLHPAA
jgi:hypothetical protein